MMILAIAPAIGAKANCIGAATGVGNVIIIIFIIISKSKIAKSKIALLLYFNLK
jgi:hypothetical protein